MDCILNVIEHDYVDSQLLTVDKKIIPERSKAPSTYLKLLYSIPQRDSKRTKTLLLSIVYLKKK